MQRPALLSIAAIALLAALTLLGLYMGAYYAALAGPEFWIDFNNPPQSPPAYLAPDYKVDGVDRVFWPAYQIDLLIRPGYWANDFPP